MLRSLVMGPILIIVWSEFFRKKAELRTSLVSTLGVDFTKLERDALKFSGEGEGEVGIFTTWVKKKLNKWEKLNKGNTATLLT